MIKFQALDPAVPLPVQLQEDTGPITVINTFVVPAELADDFLKIWGEDASFMKSQPGFVSTQMHRGFGGSQLFANIAVWESSSALLAALSNPEFHQGAAKYPDGIVTYPTAFQKVAVEGICGA
ncbi:antibiotic biosynthesis monooxygenase family protein [Nocardia tengchongensis]|uniref:antibiotic biosynthesis monooxygenase family protein n=1 Tax=Nocardia tengchongensis TaxID=2055889 RepID=UPI0033F084AA